MYSQTSRSHLPREIQVNEFLPPISLWTRVSGAVLVGTLSAVLAIATVFKYNVTVKAAAIVRPAGDLRIVQASTVGTVNRIAVQDNSVVKQGEAIAFIDSSQLQTRKTQLQAKIRQNHRQIAQLQAELRNQSSEGEGRVQEAQASSELAQSQQTAAESLTQAGAMPRSEFREKRQASAVAQARLQQAQSAASRARSELTRSQLELQAQVEQDQKELQQVETDLTKSIVRAPVSGTILKLELRNTGQQIQAGTVIAQIVPSNDPLVIKARVSAQDIAKVNVCRAAQVSDCTVGKVQIKVSAYPYPDYGTLPGAVRSVSPDVIPTQNNSPSAEAAIPRTEPTYEVTIHLDKPYLQRGDRQYLLQAGMAVTADIVAKEETVLTFVLRKARLMSDL